MCIDFGFFMLSFHTLIPSIFRTILPGYSKCMFYFRLQHMEVNGASAVNYLTNTTQKDVIRTQPIFSLIWDYGTPQIKFMSKKKKKQK